MRGWRFQSARHSLAARGITTYRKSPGTIARYKGVAIRASPTKQGRAYPVDAKDVIAQLKRTPEEDLKGLRAVEFQDPQDKHQEGAWAQLLRSKKVLKVFSQPEEELRDIERVRKHMKQYVLPHEIGHHVALNRRGITDKHIETAEARADAYAAGMDVEDKRAVSHFAKQYVRERENL